MKTTFAFFLALAGLCSAQITVSPPSGGLPETPLAINHGGTNATTSLAGIQNLTAEGSSIAAASTVDLSTATGPYLHVTGTGGPITSFGTVTTGAKFTLEFDAASSITQNATSMKLLGGISVTNVAGSVRTMKSLGSGNWQELANNDVATAVTQTITGKRVTARVTTITSSATPTINTDTCDAVTITALATAITSMTTNLTGTPNNFDQLFFRIKDSGSAEGITWGASFAARGTALPTTTVGGKVLSVLFVWNSVASTWDCISSAEE